MKKKPHFTGYGRFIAIVFLTEVLILSGCGKPADTGNQIGDYRVSLTVSPDPPAVGLNTFRVKVDHISGQPVDNAVVHLYFSMPAMAGMPAMAHEATAQSQGGGLYKAEVDLGSGGKFPWDIRLEVVRGETILAVGQWQVTPGTKGIRFVSGEATAERSGREGEGQGAPRRARNGMAGMAMGEGREKEAVAQPTEVKERQVRTVSIPLYQQQLIGVQRDTVALRPVAKTIRTVGNVAYNETKVAAVNLKFSGWIETLYVDYTGQFVKKGQPLFDIYSPELVSTQEEYLQVLREASRLVSLVSVDQEASGRRNDRQNTLLKSARERLLLWGISEEQIRQIENAQTPGLTLSFYSPITGYVVEKNALEGRYARQGTDLYTLADLSTVWVHADIYEYELPFIDTGQTARIRLSYAPGVDYVGKVDYIYPVLEPRTRTVKVRLVFPNPQLELKPDMYVDVHIDADLGRQLTIPETAVLNTGTRQLVFVDRGNGRFEPREITLGTKVDRRWVVLDGLEKGEIVVKSGNFLIDAEAHVQGVLQTM